MNNMGKHHCYTADRMVSMGNWNQKMEKHENALKYYLEALVANGSVFGEFVAPFVPDQ